MPRLGIGGTEIEAVNATEGIYSNSASRWLPATRRGKSFSPSARLLRVVEVAKRNVYTIIIILLLFLFLSIIIIIYHYYNMINMFLFFCVEREYHQPTSAAIAMFCLF